MRVVLASYPTAFQYPGGGEVQVLETARSLRAAGCEADFFDPWKTRLADYRILHYFSSKSEGLRLCRSARAQGARVAVSTVFWRDRLTVKAPPNWDWTENPAWERALSMGSEWLWRRALLREADLLLPNSQAEADRLRHWFGVSPDRVRVVPNGVDPRFDQAVPEPFVAEFGLSGFILVVGNFHPRKNQLGLLRALKPGDGFPPLVFIGSSGTDPRYEAECRREAWSGVRFLPFLPHDSPLLASAYAAAELVVLPSLFETPGLAALEGGLAGAKLALTEGGCTREYFGEHADYFHPRSASEMRSAIRRALERPRTSALRDRIRSRFLWSSVAEATLGAYRELDEGRPPTQPSETPGSIPNAAG